MAAAVGGVASMAGNIKSSNTTKKASDRASDMELEGIQETNKLQKEMWETGREDLMPWAKAGAEALDKYSTMVMEGPGEFKQSEEYDFLMNQGVQDIEASAAARGSLKSGGTLKALEKYRMGLASTEYDKFLERYYRSMDPMRDISAMGQSAAAGQGAQAMQFGSEAGSNIMQGTSGAAQSVMNSGIASGNKYVNMSNAFQQVAGGVEDAWQSYKANRTPSAGGDMGSSNDWTNKNWN